MKVQYIYINVNLTVIESTFIILLYLTGIQGKDKDLYLFTVIFPELCSHGSKSDNSKQ